MPRGTETIACIHDADVGLPRQLSHVDESKQKALFASGDRDVVLVCVQLCPQEPFPGWDVWGEWLVTSDIFLDHSPSPFPHTEVLSLHICLNFSK